MNKIIYHLLLTFLLISSHANANSENTTCIMESLKKLDELNTFAKDKKISLANISYMYQENSRTYLRSLYKLIQECPEKDFYRQVVISLSILSYPNKFLPKMFGPNLNKAGLTHFQIGSSWDKKEYIEDNADINLKKLYNAIVIMGFNKREHGLMLTSVGTGYYIGKYLDEFWIATNLHVFKGNERGLTAEEACESFSFHLPSHGKVHYLGKKLIGQWPELDLAICTIKVQPDEESKFTGKEIQFDFKNIQQDEGLITMGFNYLNEKPGRPYFDNSNDCRFFLTKITDQDGRQSLPIGCDVASGDSGSPLLNKITGKIRGMAWATTEIKSAFSSEQLVEFQNDSSKHEILWQELAQSIPSSKIGETLCAQGKEWNLDFCKAQK